jgi:hypothetical protein
VRAAVSSHARGRSNLYAVKAHFSHPLAQKRGSFVRCLTVRSLLVVAALLAAVAFAFPPAANAASENGCRGFNGTWRTSWPGGSVKMAISHGRGAYAYKGGTLSGTYDANTFSGSYAENDGSAGRFYFALTPSGNAFKGWYATSSHPHQRVVWNGVCIAP